MGFRAEILLSRNQGGLDSRAGPFLGYVQIYSFLEKYSPLKASTSISIEDISNRRNTSENVRENTKENTREDNRENARGDTRQNIRENTRKNTKEITLNTRQNIRKNARECTRRTLREHWGEH